MSGSGSLLPLLPLVSLVLLTLVLVFVLQAEYHRWLLLLTTIYLTCEPTERIGVIGVIGSVLNLFLILKEEEEEEEEEEGEGEEEEEGEEEGDPDPDPDHVALVLIVIVIVIVIGVIRPGVTIPTPASQPASLSLSLYLHEARLFTGRSGRMGSRGFGPGRRREKKREKANGVMKGAAGGVTRSQLSC